MYTVSIVTDSEPRPLEDKSPDELYKRSERVLESLHRFRDFTLEVFKARQNFYERLVLVNAGTLTLLFTVAGAVASANHSTKIHLSEAHRLVTGCWLLVVSTVLALFHNWINISTLIHSGFSQLLNTTGLDIQRLGVEASRVAGREVSMESLPALQTQQRKSHQLSVINENICRVIGPLAQVLTIWAYIEFVLSLRSTIDLMVS